MKKAATAIRFTILPLALMLTACGAGAGRATKVKKEELTRGFLLAANCYACHGYRGRSRGNIPSLAEKTPAGIEKALLEFRADRRPSTMMNRHAKGYTLEEIRALARYFGDN